MAQSRWTAAVQSRAAGPSMTLMLLFILLMAPAAGFAALPFRSAEGHHTDLAVDEVGAASEAVAPQNFSQMHPANETWAGMFKDFGMRALVEPALALHGGAQLVKTEAQIFGQALKEAMVSGAAKIGDGDISGAWQEASHTYVKASNRQNGVAREFSSAASTTATIMLIIFAVLCMWGLEHLLGEQERPFAMDELAQEDHLVHHHPALDTLRYVLSWMAVLYNFYPWTVDGVAGRREGSTANFASWGILACPAFFVLSGFCHSFNKMVGNKEEDEEEIDKPRNLLIAAAVRIMAWYPFYVLVLTFLSYNFLSYNAEDWSTYMAQLFLIGGAFLEHDQAPYPYLPSSWWFSYLAVYLIAWAPMHFILSTSGNSVVWTMFNMTYIAVFPSVLLEWWFMEDWAPFALIQYLPSFFFGQALAVWQVRNCMQKKLPSSTATKPVHVMLPMQEIPLPVRFGVSFSIIILGCVICLCSCYDRLPVVREYCLAFFLKGGLLPVFGMLIGGLACEADPLAKLMARKPLSRVGCLSLSQYMLALPVHIAVEHWTGSTGLSFAFASTLTAASVVGHFVVERPSRAFAKYIARRVNLALGEGKS
eukprot:TRINITY_DN10468_c0_g3_i1.p1 TRINITY_DN10468_c0_g3~~TRINITY_DN10468_c0_g3_i1.p1  ORF type:complete len:592 (-),score=86.59 TRINITY_DN10468_c0_g3_i1:43-1818(-)